MKEEINALKSFFENYKENCDQKKQDVNDEYIYHLKETECEEFFMVKNIRMYYTLQTYDKKIKKITLKIESKEYYFLLINKNDKISVKQLNDYIAINFKANYIYVTDVKKLIGRNRNIDCIDWISEAVAKKCNNLEIQVEIHSKEKNLSGLFRNCECLKSVNFAANYVYDYYEIDSGTNNVEDMSFMFSNCKKLESIINLNKIGNVKKFEGMFLNCERLKELYFYLNYFRYQGNMFFYNTLAKNTKDMFSGCKSLKKLNLYDLYTDNITTFENMFKECKNLEFLDISNFYQSTKCRENLSEILNDCENLTELSIKNVNFSIDLDNLKKLKKNKM